MANQNYRNCSRSTGDEVGGKGSIVLRLAYPSLTVNRIRCDPLGLPPTCGKSDTSCESDGKPPRSGLRGC